MFLQAFLRMFLPMNPPEPPGLNEMLFHVNGLVHTVVLMKNSIHFLHLIT